jgi:hypothetical protein
MILKYLFFVAALVLPLFPTMACKMKGPDELGYYYSFSNGKNGFFAPKTEEKVKFATLAMGSCDDLKVRKFFEVRLGPVEASLNSHISRTVISKNYRPLQCKINNSKIKPHELKDQISFHENKRAFLELCVETHVVDKGSKEIIFLENQEWCAPTRVSPKEVVINGPQCYFKVQPNSNFFVYLKTKKECDDPAYLRKNGVFPAEFLAEFSTFLTDSEDGRGLNFTTIGKSLLRFILGPEEKLIPTGVSYNETVSYPLTWVLPNVEVGEIKIQKKKTVKNSTFIRLPLMVDNRCKKVCKNGKCVGPCHFIQPLAGEVNLFQEVDGKKEFITTWYTGGAVPANWQGKVEGVEERVFRDLTPGKYNIEVIFRDPTEDWRFFTKDFNSKIGRLSTDLSTSRIGTVFGEHPTIASGTFDLSGLASSISRISRGTKFDSLKRARFKFHNLFTYKYWPPMYEKICDQNLEACERLGGSKKYLKFNIDFNLIEEKVRGRTDIPGMPNQFNKRLALKEVKVKRESTHLPDYQMEVTKFPKGECKRPAPVPVPPRPTNNNEVTNNNSNQ